MRIIFANVGPFYFLEGAIKSFREYSQETIWIHQNESIETTEKDLEDFLNRHRFEGVELLLTPKSFNTKFLKSIGYDHTDIQDVENIGLYHEAGVYWLKHYIKESMLIFHSDVIFTSDPTSFLDHAKEERFERIATELIRFDSFPSNRYLAESDISEARVCTPFLYLHESVNYDIEVVKRLLSYTGYRPLSLKGFPAKSEFEAYITEHLQLDSITNLFITNHVDPKEMLQKQKIDRPFIHFHNGQSVLKFLIKNKGWDRLDKPSHYITRLQAEFKDKVSFFDMSDYFSDFFADNMGSYFET